MDRSVFTPFDHQITKKKLKYIGFYHFHKGPRSKIGCLCIKGPNSIFFQIYFKVLLPYNHYFHTMKVSKGAKGNISLARQYFPSNGIAKLIIYIINLDYGFRTFVSLKCVRFYSTYVNQLFYPGFRCCTRKK